MNVRVCIVDEFFYNHYSLTKSSKTKHLFFKMFKNGIFVSACVCVCVEEEIIIRLFYDKIFSIKLIR